MSTTVVLLIVLLIWLAVGVVASVVMGRRGHAPFSWAVLGAVLGPLVVPLAISSIRRERNPVDSVQAPSASGEGPVDVLVGVDGSGEARQALRCVVDLLGPRIGRLTLASVLDFDTAETSEQRDERRLAEQHLDEMAVEAAAVWGVGVPGRALLAGRPADALVRFAGADGYDLIAIGCRGRGMSKAAFGSVASRLARASGVRVLVVSV